MSDETENSKRNFTETESKKLSPEQMEDILDRYFSNGEGEDTAARKKRLKDTAVSLGMSVKSHPNELKAKMREMLGDGSLTEDMLFYTEAELEPLEPESAAEAEIPEPEEPKTQDIEKVAQEVLEDIHKEANEPKKEINRKLLGYINRDIKEPHNNLNTLWNIVNNSTSGKFSAGDVELARNLLLEHYTNGLSKDGYKMGRSGRERYEGFIRKLNDISRQSELVEGYDNAVQADNDKRREAANDAHTKYEATLPPREEFTEEEEAAGEDLAALYNVRKLVEPLRPPVPQDLGDRKPATPNDPETVLAERRAEFAKVFEQVRAMMIAVEEAVNDSRKTEQDIQDLELKLDGAGLIQKAAEFSPLPEYDAFYKEVSAWAERIEQKLKEKHGHNKVEDERQTEFTGLVEQLRHVMTELEAAYEDKTKTEEEITELEAQLKGVELLEKIKQFKDLPEFKLLSDEYLAWCDRMAKTHAERSAPKVSAPESVEAPKIPSPEEVARFVKWIPAYHDNYIRESYIKMKRSIKDIDLIMQTDAYEQARQEFIAKKIEDFKQGKIK